MVSREMKLYSVVAVATLVLLVDGGVCWGMEIKTLLEKSDDQNENMDGRIWNSVSNTTNKLLQAVIADFEKVETRSNVTADELTVAYIRNKRNISFTFFYRESKTENKDSPHVDLSSETAIVRPASGSVIEKIQEKQWNSKSKTGNKPGSTRSSEQPAASIVMDASPALLIIIAFMGITLFLFLAIIVCLCQCLDNGKNTHKEAALHGSK